MARRYYKIFLMILYLAVFVCIVYLFWRHYAVDVKGKSKLAPKTYDAIIINQNTTYEDIADSRPYELPYLRIKNIGFKLDNDFIYLKFQLAGDLPETKDLPSINGDQIKDVFYTVSMDENYFDYSGHKNPGGPEAKLKLSLYSTSITNDEKKINVEGELIKGGQGFDYFVVRYPYQQLLLNRNSTFIVFTADSNISSIKYPEGVITNKFRNSDLAASKSDNTEILLDLFLKDVKY